MLRKCDYCGHVYTKRIIINLSINLDNNNLVHVGREASV